MSDIVQRQTAHVTTPEFQTALSGRIAEMRRRFQRLTHARSGMTQDDVEHIATQLREWEGEARALEGSAGDDDVCRVRQAHGALHSAEQLIAEARTALARRVGEAEVDPDARISATLSDAIGTIIAAQVTIGGRRA